MQFQISIENLRIEAVIGILAHERLAPQEILADCQIIYKRSDEGFINYAEVVTVIETMLQENRYALIEDALEEIIDALVKLFDAILTIKLKLSKPQILDNCTVAVELFRKI